jgi:hypothetical protein
MNAIKALAKWAMNISSGDERSLMRVCPRPVARSGFVSRTLAARPELAPYRHAE